MPKRMMHLAQFLCHGPTYHSLAMWRHPRTAEAGYDWARPELYQHIARVCERGKFDMVFFADLNYISDTYRGTMDPAIRHATQAPEHDPIPLLSFMAAVTTRIGLGATLLDQPRAPVLRRAPVGDARSPDARARGLERGDVAQPQPVRELRRGAPADRRALRPRARVHRGLPQALGQLGAGRGRDGSRGRASSPIPPRCIASSTRAGSSGRAARSTSCARPQHGPAILQAGTSPKGRTFAARYADAIFAIQPNIAGAKALLRRHQARHGEARGARPRRARSCSASSRSSARRRRRRARSRRCTTAWCRSRAAWRSSPATSTSISRRCRSTS